MIKDTAIVGMGALGLMYADVIAQALGQGSVRFVMDADRVKKYQDTVTTINGEVKTFRMEDQASAHPADLVIVAVKYNSLPDALETMKNLVGENTVIMSVMNGISSEEIIGERYGDEKMIVTVAQGMDAMKFGSALRYTKMGELHIGARYEFQNENVAAVRDFFEEVKMPYLLEDDIMYRLWAKFMLNVGVNQTCHAFCTTYSGCLAEGTPENEIFLAAMREVVRIANLEGIGLSEKEVKQYCDIIATLDPDGVPSMRQDGIAKRRSEVEMFAGTVLRLAKKHGIQAPANQLLYDRIAEMEEHYER